jgi:SAM-dependent methyltransferase
MLDLAKSKIEETGVDKHSDIELSFEHGSAFDLEALDENVFPVVVCLVNSIGVMQGREGAQKLFASIKRLLEKTGGIAIISCYLQEYVEAYALNQYESTLDVSGQPVWLGPKNYADSDFKMISKNYKRAHDNNTDIEVDVYDKNDNLVKENFILKRIPGRTRATVCSGNIQTHTDYESHWYNYFVINQWMKKYWGKESYHIRTKELDRKRAEPAQVAIYDPKNLLKKFLNNYYNTNL